MTPLGHPLDSSPLLVLQNLVYNFLVFLYRITRLLPFKKSPIFRIDFLTLSLFRTASHPIFILDFLIRCPIIRLKRVDRKIFIVIK